MKSQLRNCLEWTLNSILKVLPQCRILAVGVTWENGKGKRRSLHFQAPTVTSVQRTDFRKVLLQRPHVHLSQAGSVHWLEQPPLAAVPALRKLPAPCHDHSVSSTAAACPVSRLWKNPSDKSKATKTLQSRNSLTCKTSQMYKQFKKWLAG